MPDPMTEPLEPYEPQTTAYEWDDEEEEVSDRPNVLWGRVGIFAAALLVAFMFGRWTAPGGVPGSQVTELQAEITSLKEDNTDLRKQLAAAQDALEEPDPVTSPAAEASPSAEETVGTTDTTIPEVTGETYVVKPNDSLSTISQDFYGTTEYADLIAEANGITDPGALQVGQELTIPPKPE
jgi:LysM repeat protein